MRIVNDVVRYRLNGVPFHRAPELVVIFAGVRSFQRLYTQLINDVTYLLKNVKYMASARKGIRQLLGADLLFHTATPERDTDMERFAHAVAASKLQGIPCFL